jgi:predicted small secreted protein
MMMRLIHSAVIVLSVCAVLAGCCATQGFGDDENALIEACRDFCQDNIDQCSSLQLFSGGTRENCASGCVSLDDKAGWASCGEQWVGFMECAAGGDPCDYQTRCDVEEAEYRSCIEQYCAANPDRCDGEGPLPPGP